MLLFCVRWVFAWNSRAHRLIIAVERVLFGFTATSYSDFEALVAVGSVMTASTATGAEIMTAISGVDYPLLGFSGVRRVQGRVIGGFFEPDYPFMGFSRGEQVQGRVIRGFFEPDYLLAGFYESRWVQVRVTIGAPVCNSLASYFCSDQQRRTTAISAQNSLLIADQRRRQRRLQRFRAVNTRAGAIKNWPIGASSFMFTIRCRNSYSASVKRNKTLKRNSRSR